MKRMIVWVVLLAFLQIFGGVAAAAPAIPGPSSNHFYVLDKAGVLSDAAESKIQTISTQLAGRTKAQVVVLTIRSLEEAPIEDYALEVLRSWGIGDKQLNNGVLILVAVDDRQSRIEVGYGLEGALPDGKTGRIQDEYMIPFFKSGGYEQGILNGYNAVVNEVAAEYKVALSVEKPQSKRQTKPEDPWASLPWWGKLLLAVGIGGLIIIDLTFFGGQITWLLISLLFRGGRGGPGGGSGGGGSGGGGGSSRRW